MDALGGLAKRMPFSAAIFAVGAVAICGLPPLNGFAGEWLLYLGFFNTLNSGGPPGIEAAAAAAVALATIGALAVACFVRILGAVFLGSPREPDTGKAHDPTWTMKAPMAILALACLALGLFPSLAAPFLDAAVGAWAPVPAGSVGLAMPPLAKLAHLSLVSALGIGLLVLAALFAIPALLLPKAKKAPRPGTWDCGYAAPENRMQYGASSFGRTIVELFSFALLPSSRAPKIEGSFPAKAKFRSRVPDPVLDRAIRPLFAAGRRSLPRVRFLQQGQTQVYILYILIIAIILLIAGWLGVRP